MIKQPIKEYLENHVEYRPNSNGDPCREWNKAKTYDNKAELIKCIFTSFYYNRDFTANRLFKRYMNNSYWTWKND